MNISTTGPSSSLGPALQSSGFENPIKVGPFSDNPESAAPSSSSKNAEALESAVDVEISPEAKARFERVRSEQEAAKLIIRLLNSDPSDGSKQLVIDEIAPATSAEEEESDASQIAQSPDKNGTFDEFFSETYPGLAEARKTLLLNSVKANHPEGAERLQEAINNGTALVRKAEDVPGLNLKTNVVYSIGPGGGGMSTQDRTFNPSAEIRAEIDAGRAATSWNINHGDLYITW